MFKHIVEIYSGKQPDMVQQKLVQPRVADSNKGVNESRSSAHE